MEIVEIVELKFPVLESAFDRFERAHIACVEGVDSPEELQALSDSFEAEFQKYYEFGERIKEWLSCARADQMASAVQPGDSVSQHNAPSATNKSHLSDGSSSSCLGVKIKVAKAEKLSPSSSYINSGGSWSCSENGMLYIENKCY